MQGAPLSCNGRPNPLFLTKHKTFFRDCCVDKAKALIFDTRSRKQQCACSVRRSLVDSLSSQKRRICYYNKFGRKKDISFCFLSHTWFMICCFALRYSKFDSLPVMITFCVLFLTSTGRKNAMWWIRIREPRRMWPSFFCWLGYILGVLWVRLKRKLKIPKDVLDKPLNESYFWQLVWMNAWFLFLKWRRIWRLLQVAWVVSKQ